MSKSSLFARADRARLAGLAIPVVIVLFLALNVMSVVVFRSARVDLTADRLFTVTASTRTVLGEVKEPITLRLYASQKLLDSVPRLKSYGDRVVELLSSYRQLSGGKVRFERVDPQAFSAEEDRAIGYQMRGFMVDRSGEQGYFGLVGTNSVDGLEKIVFLDPQREDMLEYDLTSLVRRLAHPDKPNVGVITGLRMFGSMEQQQFPMAILDMINKGYHVRDLSTPPVKLDDIDILMIAHPVNLPPATLYAIDQHAMAGKPILLFMDPLAENSPPNPRNQALPLFPTSDLGPLLKSWGVAMADKKVVGDRNMALRVTASAGRQRIVASYMPWLQVRRDALNTDDPVMNAIQLMRITSAGALSPAEGATTTFTPLIHTTPNSMLYESNEIMQRPDPNVLMQKFVAGGKEFVLAARVTGPAKTAYPDGPPPPPEGATDPAPDKSKQITSTKAPINIIMVADTDLLADNHIIGQGGQTLSNNGDFVLNSLDSLAGGAELLGLRGRGVSLRSFTRVEQMEAAAESNYQTTERKLSQDLEDTQKQLAQAQTEGGDSAQGPVFTREQQETIAKFNRQIVDLRRQLRDVRAAGRADIDRLQTWLQVINIALVPLALILIGLLTWMVRRIRLSHYLRERKLLAGAQA